MKNFTYATLRLNNLNMTTNYKQIVLQANQVPHVTREMEILSYSHLAADNSKMGLGKTFTTCAVALLMGFTDVYVVATSSLESRWAEMGTIYGIPIRLVTTYQSLRSTWGHQPGHGLLSRVDTVDDKGKRNTEFKPTQQGVNGFGGVGLMDLLATKQCLFVFDEYQHIKNLSDQHDAVAALSAAIILSGGKSRMMFLSGAPFDKEEHIVNFLKMVGIIRSHRLFVYHNDEGRLELIGAQELIDYCKIFDEPGTLEFLQNDPMTKANVRRNCYLLYIQILASHITSSMKPLTKEENDAAHGVTLDLKNAYVNMSPENQAAYELAIGELRNFAAFDVQTGNYDAKKANWAAIDSSLRASEKSKWDEFIRLAKADLDANPNAKVVIGLNSDISWHHIFNYFQNNGYRPLLMYGKTTKPQRTKTIKQFQEHNNNYRILIGNLRVIGEGLDLDDKFGDQPRSAYGSPSYYIQYMHQFGGRFKRGESTMSNAKVRFVYGKAGKMETSIINSLSKKGKIMAETLPEQTETGTKFPDEYEAEIEPDPPGVTTNFKLYVPDVDRRENTKRAGSPVQNYTGSLGNDWPDQGTVHGDYGTDDDDFYPEDDNPRPVHAAPKVAIPVGYNAGTMPQTVPITTGNGFAVPMTKAAMGNIFPQREPVPIPTTGNHPPAIPIPMVATRPVYVPQTPPPVIKVNTPPLIQTGAIPVATPARTIPTFTKPTIPTPVVTTTVLGTMNPPLIRPVITTPPPVIRPASPPVTVKPQGFGLYAIPLPVNVTK
jgi:hypothetical protein